MAHASPAPDQRGVVVGRVTDIEGGQLLRYVPEQNDWVVTVKNTPFGLNDTLYSDPDTKAEIDVPNNTRIRIAGNTQLQAISLGDALTEVDVSSGEARVYNNSSAGQVKATLPLGSVLAPAGSVFDVHVADQSTEVVAVRGKVDFVYASTNQTYPVIAGATALVADSGQVTSKEVPMEVAWNDWNLKRDEFWSARAQVAGNSHTYLPANLRDDSYELDQNGKWERVYYQGSYHQFWRPTQVAADWAPFTMGRWTDYYGDYAWIPDEPFGYVTHHYGNWLWIDAANAWYWAPPVLSVGLSLGCPYCWFPGRVAWIFSGADIGWFPLAPLEPYYCHRWWGRGSYVLRNGYANRIHVRLNRYRYARHAVIVNQHNLFGMSNYHTVRLANLNRRTMERRFRVTPVLNERVVRNLRESRQRYAFTNASPTRRPGAAALERIRRNERITRTGLGGTSRSAERNPARTRQRQAAANVQTISPNRTTNTFQRSSTRNRHTERALSTHERGNRVREERTISRRPEAQSGRAFTGRARTNERAQSRHSATRGQPNSESVTSGAAVRGERSRARALERSRAERYRTNREAARPQVDPRARSSFTGESRHPAHEGISQSGEPRRAFQGERNSSFGAGREQRPTTQAHGRACRRGVC